MSNSLAIAAVTAVLRDAIVNRMALPPVSTAVGPVTVSSLPPDRIDVTGANDPDQINVFLHQLSRNTGWAGADLPGFDPGGERVGNPPLVLNLHYLVTTYGQAPYHAEILLGEVVQAFHERPIFTPAEIEAALHPAVPPGDFLEELGDSGLDRQFERIRIVPESLNTEELSRLWSAMQTNLRLTAAFQVSAVMLESRRPTRRALPVRRPLGNAVPAARPVLAGVAAAGDPAAPIVPGVELRLTGRRLTAEDMSVSVEGIDLTAEISERSSGEVVLALPSPPPPGLRAGVARVRILHRRALGDPPVPHDAVSSNLEVFVLRPLLSLGAPAVTESVMEDGDTLQSGTLELTLEPAVGVDQEVALLLNDLASGRSYRLLAPEGNGIAAPATETAAVQVPFERVVAGTYVARVEVDGAESVLTADGSGVFDGPTVTF